MLELRTLFFEDLAVGMTETLNKTVASSDVIGFAQLTGDRNPIHLSEHFAAKTSFGARIAHGLYTASLISAVLGTRLPGPGAVYVSQTLNFRAPVRIGDTVEVTVAVAELFPERLRARLTCICRVGNDIVLESCERAAATETLARAALAQGFAHGFLDELRQNFGQPVELALQAAHCLDEGREIDPVEPLLNPVKPAQDGGQVVPVMPGLLQDVARYELLAIDLAFDNSDACLKLGKLPLGYVRYHLARIPTNPGEFIARVGECGTWATKAKPWLWAHP